MLNIQRKKQTLKTHSLERFLNVRNKLYVAEIMKVLWTNIFQDSPGGDITTETLDLSDKKIVAVIRAKEAGILAGIQELKYFFNKLPQLSHQFGKVRITYLKKDGDSFRASDSILKLEGLAGEILIFERTILNFLQRMCGIATQTKRYIHKAGKDVLVTPTRKTILGLLDKRACVVGGAGTHRLHLSDAILVKNTHLKILKLNFAKLIQKLEAAPAKKQFIEVEVSNFKQARELVEIFEQSSLKEITILLDNMKPTEIKKVIAAVRKRRSYKNIIFEASGGINFQNIKTFAKTGVDILSLGALTHSVRALDLSLKVL